MTKLDTSGYPSPKPFDLPYQQINDIPPRLQWENNSGYCGEVSMISAGLYYGQYMSQYDMREIAMEVYIPPIHKQNNKKAQLLLGIPKSTQGEDTIKAVADKLHLKSEVYTNYQSTGEFVAWVKQHVIQGHPVIICSGLRT